MPPLREVPRRMLVVDDDPAILDLVCTRLTIAGHTVLSARNGHEALKRLGERRYDAMVLDLNMPQLDGFGVLERMAKLSVPSPPTLVLTASHNATHVQRAIKLGARDYLSKPFDDRQLLMRVARLFRRPADRRSLEEVIDGMDDLLVGRTPEAGAARAI
jgi:DNA-binding response OmpR family regulator